MLVKLEQPEKVDFPSDVTDEGIFTLCKCMHPQKQYSPFFVIDEGSKTLVTVLQSRKQPSSRAVTGYFLPSLAVTF